MSRERRREMVDRQHPALSTLRQCALLGISRSSVYYRPRAPSQKDLALMEQIDQQYLATPFLGVGLAIGLAVSSNDDSESQTGVAAAETTIADTPKPVFAVGATAAPATPAPSATPAPTSTPALGSTPTPVQQGSNNPPVITSAAVTTTAAGRQYLYDVEATDPDVGDVLAFSLDAAPPGMRIDPATGLIEWTPSIASLFSTGVDDTGVPLPAGSVDPHFTLISSADPRFPGPNTFVNSSIPGAWLPNSSSLASKWIAPADNAGQDFADPRSIDYIYQTTFDLTGFAPGSVVITGRAISDNGGEVFINGVRTYIYTGHFESSLNSASFTISSDFVSEVNTLEFHVNNATQGATNPTGLRVELSGVGDRIDLGEHDVTVRVQDQGGLVATHSFVVIVAPAEAWWITRSPVPTPRGALVAETLSDGIHVVGGSKKTESGWFQFTAHEVYHPETDTWSVKAPAPDLDMWDPASAVANGNLFLIGGWASCDCAAPTLIRMYDPTLDTWEYKAPIPNEGFNWGPSNRLLKNGVWQWDRVLKTLILRSSWRKLGRWSRTLGLCCFLNPVLRGCRAWVAHCQVMPPWLLALPLPAPGVWPYGPDCRPWLPGTPPDRSGPAPDIASFGTRPLFSSTRRSPQPVSESAD